jgi:hypothetical protein
VAEGALEIVYFTVVAIGLYFVSDWLLRRIETARGEILEHRSVVFLLILLSLALASFSLIRYLTG